ncbi:MAG: hypothetical protein JSR33_04775 [Proteobacteria bacterium]|nr:hypothetical protein [Pseudomonadota bacterium]
MSTVIKVPPLPYGAAEATVGHWYKKINEVVARNEILVELWVRDEIIPIYAPQPGILERILLTENTIAPVQAVLAWIKTGLPNLVWDPELDGLILDNYRADGVNSSMEYELRIMLREKVAKNAKGFGSGLALPQQPQTQAAGHGQGHGHGQDYGIGQSSEFETHPFLGDSSQFAGDRKDPRVNTIPSNEEFSLEYAYANRLGLSAMPAPSAPTLKASR